MGLDAGYMTAAICKGLEDRELYGVIGYRRLNHKKGYFHKRQYVYDRQAHVYICPAEKRLRYSTTTASDIASTSRTRVFASTVRCGCSAPGVRTTPRY